MIGFQMTDNSFYGGKTTGKEKAIAEAEIEISKQKIHDAQKQMALFTRNISEKNKLIETL